MTDGVSFEEFVKMVKLYYRLEYDTVANWENEANESLMFEAFDKGYTVQDCCGALRDTISKE